MAYKIPLEIIEIEHDNFHPLVTAVFADGFSGNWVVDTGASKSVFDRNLSAYFRAIDGEAEDLHSAGISNKPIKSGIGIVAPFSFSSLKIEQLKVALLDMKHINELYAATTDVEICGLLGSDFLVRHRAIINFRRSCMILRK